MGFAKSDSGEVRPEVFSRDDHHISRQNIDSDAIKIMYRLIRNGFKAYMVGGGVRDLLLNKKPKDFDIATDATPRRIKDLFRNSRIIGRRFKLVHIFFKDNKVIEVSTFRDASDPIDPEDETEKGEKSEETRDRDTQLQTRDNKYGTEVTDALRRDITINGLFYDLSTFSIIDYVGGMSDLKARIVRVIGEPDVRFAEDPVRMIRVVRHAVRSGFIVEETCWKSILRNRELLKQSSQVRVYEEIKKDLVSGYGLPILRLLEKSGLLELLVPELSRDGRLLAPQSQLAMCLASADHQVLSGQPISHTSILSLIALFVGCDDHCLSRLSEKFVDMERLSEHVVKCFSNMQVPRKEREKICEIIYYFNRLVKDGPERIKPAAFSRFEHVDELAAVLRFTDNSGSNQALIDFVADFQNRGGHGHHHGGRHERHQRDGRRHRRGKTAFKRFI